MLRGKKSNAPFDTPSFEYLGETVMIPSNVEMKIDFLKLPKNPTQCLALAIDQSKISSTLHLLNERYPKAGNDSFGNENDTAQRQQKRTTFT
jgi:hypothetical protein